MEPPTRAGWAAGGRVPWTWDRVLAPRPQSSGLSCRACFLSLQWKIPGQKIFQHFCHTKERKPTTRSTFNHGKQISRLEFVCDLLRSYLPGASEWYCRCLFLPLPWWCWLVSERAQSNVTDITSGHKAAADCGLAGGCESCETAGPDRLERTPGLHNTNTFTLQIRLLCGQLVSSRTYFVMPSWW